MSTVTVIFAFRTTLRPKTAIARRRGYIKRSVGAPVSRVLFAAALRVIVFENTPRPVT